MGNLPGMLAEAGIGVDGVPVRTAAVAVEKTDEDQVSSVREIEPTLFPSMRV